MALMGRALLCGVLLCSITWASVRTDEGSVSPVLLKHETRMNITETRMNITETRMNITETRMNITEIRRDITETRRDITETTTSNYTGLSCVSLLPPRRGSFYVEEGSSISVGSVLVFWCLDGYQLVGSEKISCVLRSNAPQWSNHPPDCEAIPKPEDRGLRVAVLASVVSSIVIFAMSVSFIICCLQERMSKDRSERAVRRGRMREKHDSCWRSECWLEREEGDWEAFPPPKIYNLSQHVDLRRPPEIPACVGGLTGYDNRGYQRSQENLLKASLPGLYHSESQMYPHVVLQRMPTPTVPTVPTAPCAPVYLRLSTPPPTESPSKRPVLPPYPKPFHHSPSGTPQRLLP